MTHTPTPWMSHGSDVWDVLGNDEPGIPLLRGAFDADRRWGRKLTNAEREANAAHIVRCANNFDEAREWIKAALNMIDGNGTPPNWDGMRDFLKRTEA